jgi:hypothetical protein
MSRPPSLEPSLLDEILPRWDHRTVHGHATPAGLEAAARAMREAEVGEAKMARSLMAVRTLGRARGAQLRRPWVEVGDTDAAFVKLAESPHEIVLGFVGRPWPGGDPAETAATREEFVAYEPDDTVKVAMSLRVASAEYGTLLLTETRIVVGPAARRTFDLYWRAIRVGSGLVRRSLLRAIARRAEAHG